MAAAYEEFLKKIQEGLNQKEQESTLEQKNQHSQQTGATAACQQQQTKGTTLLQKPLKCQKPTAEPSARNVATSESSREQKNIREPMSFKTMYEKLCDNIRSSGTLDTIMEDFQDFKTDLERVSYVSQFDIVEGLTVAENYAKKNAEDASNYEKVYDMLIPNEASATKALDVMNKCLQKTPIEDTKALAIRYMKRAWAFLLLEQFDHAQIDAKKSLTFNCPVELVWNSYEILGHASTKKKEYKEAETFFLKALENLRKSNVSNDVKATATVRIMSVFKTVKGKKNNKTKAKNPNEIQDENKTSLPQVSYGVHKNFLSASSALDFIVTEARGRCTVTNRDVKPGDILMVDSPYASMLSAEVFSTHCYNCFRRCPVAIPCQSCAKVSYCSEECRGASWAGPHASECHVLDHLTESTVGIVALLAFRILVTVTWPKLQKMKDDLNKVIETEIQNAGEGHEGSHIPQQTSNTSTQNAVIWNGKYDPHDYKPAFHLATNASKRAFGDIFKRSLTAVYLTHCLKLTGYFGQEQEVKEDDFLFVSSIMLRHLQGASSNGYEISELEFSPKGKTFESKQIEIGGAIYSTISLTNHACVSNTCRYYIGNTCILRATRSIAKGEEVFDNYGYYYNTSTVNERQEGLSRQYKFTCDCKACVKGWPLYPHHPQETLVFRCPQQNCGRSCCYSNSSREKCNMCGNKDKYMELLYELEEQLKMYKNAVNMVKVADIKGGLSVLLNHQIFLDRHVVEPVMHFTDVQEAIKQCYFYLGNKYNPVRSLHTPADTKQQQTSQKLKPKKTKVMTQK